MSEVKGYKVRDLVLRDGKLHGTHFDQVVYLEADYLTLARAVRAVIEEGMGRYAELFEHAGLGQAKDSVWMQQAQALLLKLETRIKELEEANPV